MRVTIFGATGMLGKALMHQWTGDDVAGLGSVQADIRVPEQVEQALAQTKPDWMVLSAAYTDVDGCELDPTLASAVNTRGAINVARAARAVGAKLLFISTDYVFDGKNTAPYEAGDPRNPINVYGRTKAEAEAALLNILPDCCIVRTSWLFGPWGKCFPDTILKLAAGRPEIEVVTDQRGCPTYTFDLASTIVQLCRLNARGTLHATNRGECSWHEFASEIIRQAGLGTVVRPTSSDRFVRPAARPQYSVLSGASLKAYEIEMRSWQETIPEYLRGREKLT
jgi:dTDP-4-dehydrorhamnose reductase